MSIQLPTLLFYCQHSLGMGHLVRSFRLAKALAREFHVVFLNGGPIPEGIRIPPELELIPLPPLGMSDDGHALVSRDARYSVERAKAVRRLALQGLLQARAPAVVLIELFPFGRKKFRDELVPLLESAQQTGPQRPIILCSLRDLLVHRQNDQQRFDNRVAETLNRYFDAVLVHSDPAFASLEESFNPQIPLQVPVYYTGFVTTSLPMSKGLARKRRVLVSAGGGIVGAPLYRAALGACRQLSQAHQLSMTLVAGPFLPESDWRALQHAAGDQQGLTLKRTVPGLVSWLQTSRVSVSQCGYNTAMELLQSRVKALVVPFAEGNEDEQMNRARRLQRAGALKLLHPDRLSPQTLCDAIAQLLHVDQQPIGLNMQGAEASLDLINELLGRESRQREAVG